MCWKPGLLTQSGVTHTDTNVTVIHMFDCKDCDIWFMRFSMDLWQRILVLGNQVGRTYVWDLAVTDPTHSRCTVLSHPKCTTAMRQTAPPSSAYVTTRPYGAGLAYGWRRWQVAL